MKRKNNRKCSGQILVIAILVVSLILLSTQLYIYEVGQSLKRTQTSPVNDFVIAVKLGTKHMVTGSLANISTGGSNSILHTNLEGWTSFVESLYQFGKPVLSFTLENTLPYNNGTQLSWNDNGYGTSSAYAVFNFSLQDHKINILMPYTVNVTTSLIVEGVYRTLHDNVRQINVTCNVLNEGDPALAQNVTLFFDDGGLWRRAEEQSNYYFADYGNGTYLISFEAEISQENVNVSAQVHDLRGIYVQANATCSSVP